MKPFMPVCFLCAFVAAAPLSARQPADAGKGPADIKPADAEAFKLRLVEIKGRAFHSPIGTEAAKDDGWTRLKKDDLLTSGAQIRTSHRATVKFAMEPATPPSIIMIEGYSLVSIDELFKASDAASGEDAVVTRIGLAYGAVRAGVAEGDVRSDLEIRSPVATLAKKGTWGFRFYVERNTGHFQISLADRGLVQAIQNASGRTMTIQPGQFVTQQMARWVETVRFDQVVNVQDWYGLKGAELIFNLANQTGLGVLTPGGDPVSILDLTGKQSQQLFANLIDSQLGDDRPDRANEILLQQSLQDFNTFGPRRRPEGNFGVGQSAVPIFVSPSSDVARTGAAQPGRMDFWRADLNAFSKKQRQHGRR